MWIVSEIILQQLTKDIGEGANIREKEPTAWDKESWSANMVELRIYPCPK